MKFDENSENFSKFRKVLKTNKLTLSGSNVPRQFLGFREKGALCRTCTGVGFPSQTLCYPEVFCSVCPLIRLYTPFRLARFVHFTWKIWKLPVARRDMGLGQKNKSHIILDDPAYIMDHIFFWVPPPDFGIWGQNSEIFWSFFFKKKTLTSGPQIFGSRSNFKKTKPWNTGYWCI